MAGASRYKAEDFPPPGAVFLMPLADGRNGICRVLRVEKTEHSTQFHAVVATSEWIGDAPPALSDPSVRRILKLTHHRWRGDLEIIWVPEPPPRKFTMIGKLRPTPADRNIRCYSHSGWESLPLQRLAQWRWEHDRDAVLREDAENQRADQLARNQAAREHARYLSSLTFSKLKKTKLLPNWKGDHPAEAAVRASRHILQSLISTLDAATKPLSKDFVSKNLQKTVQELNNLDAEMQFIETEEREDLCEAFEAILHAAKHPLLLNKVDEWRDW